MNFDFLIFPDLEELYLVGPWEIITAWKGHQGGPDQCSTIAAGISAGIDLALAFIADQTDEETAGQVQSYTEYYPLGKNYGQEHLRPDAPQYLKD